MSPLVVLQALVGIIGVAAHRLADLHAGLDRDAGGGALHEA